MSEKIKIALHRFSVYNPGRMSDDEVIASFVARRAVFERIFSDLKQEINPGIAQSHLIIGQRGMGKTTLLMRLAAELRKPEWNTIFIPLTFAEEQYVVDRLSKFWMNCLDSFADAMERRDEKKSADRIDAAVRHLERRLAAKTTEIELAKDAQEAFLETASETGLRPIESG